MWGIFRAAPFPIRAISRDFAAIRAAPIPFRAISRDSRGSDSVSRDFARFAP